METWRRQFQEAQRLQTEGRRAEAMRVYEEALAGLEAERRNEPRRRDLIRIHVRALRNIGRKLRAREVLMEACEYLPRKAEMHEALGKICSELEDFEGAEHAYRRCLELDAGRRTAVEGLVQALTQRDRHVAAVELLDRELVRMPDDPNLLHFKGNILIAAGQYGEAGKVFERLAGLTGDNPAVRFNLGISAIKQGHLESAREIFAHLDGFQEDEVRYYRALVNLLSGETEAALEGFNEALQLNPRQITSWWYRGHCLRELGRDEEARPWFAPEALAARLNPLAGMEGGARTGLLQELSDYVQNYPFVHWEPGRKTTRGGWQTSSLTKAGDTLTRGFERLVHQTADAWLQGLPADHPLNAHRPDKFRIELWATILRAGGHQRPHIHPGGWVSGVFYTSLPDDWDETGEAGWLEFGDPPYDTVTTYTPWKQRVRPEPGLMVLFPSWLPHRTVPFESGQARISLAFDLIPVTR